MDFHLFYGKIFFHHVFYNMLENELLSYIYHGMTLPWNRNYELLLELVIEIKRNFFLLWTIFLLLYLSTISYFFLLLVVLVVFYAHLVCIFFDIRIHPSFWRLQFLSVGMASWEFCRNWIGSNETLLILRLL